MANALAQRRLKKPPKERASKAEHFHKSPIELSSSDRCEGWVYTAQDATGKWYGSVSLTWGDGVEIPDLLSQMTPSHRRKYATETEAATDALQEAATWINQRLVDPVGNLTLVDQERLRSVREALRPIDWTATKADRDEDLKRLLDRLTDLAAGGTQSEDWNQAADPILEEYGLDGSIPQHRLTEVRRLIEEAELEGGTEGQRGRGTKPEDDPALDHVLCGNCGTTVGQAAELVRTGQQATHKKASGGRQPPDSRIPGTRELASNQGANAPRSPKITAVTRGAGVEEIVDLPLEVVHRHPRNRVPAAAEVDELAATIAAFGRQMEPVTVRDCSGLQELPAGHYELLSGERRWLALQKLGWAAIRARVLRGVSDVDGLWHLAAANCGRVDLNAIERAEVLAHLVAPVEAGGAGKSMAEAGALWGIKEGTVRSTIRLRKLTPVLQAKVASGELPERVARYLVPYAGLTKVMEAVEAAFEQPYCWWLEPGTTEADVKLSVEILVHKHTRPIDPAVKHDYGYQLGNEHRRLFGKGKEKFLAEDVRQSLGVQQVTIDGKQLEVATNVEAYDALQVPLIQAKLAKRQGYAAWWGDPRRAPAKSDKEKDREQDERLAKVTRRTVHELLRCHFAATLVEGHECVEPLRTWIEATGFWKRANSEWSHDLLPRTEFARAAAIETVALANPRFLASLGRQHPDSMPHPTPGNPGANAPGSPGRKRGKQSDVPATVLDQILFAIRCEGDPDGGADRFRWRLVRLYLWPCSEVIPIDHPDVDQASKTLYPILLDLQQLPESIAVLDHEETVQAAGLIKVTIDKAWTAAAVDGQCRLIVARWLKAHTRKQLERQGKEWGNACFGSAKVSEIAAELLGEHRGKGLKLPAFFTGKKH